MEVGSISGNRNLLISLLLIAEIAGWTLYFIYHYQPNQARIQDLQKIVVQKNREVREIELTKRMLSEVRQEIERLKADISRLEKFFPEEVFVPRVLVLIENLADATHIKIESITPATGRRSPTAGAGVAEQPAPEAATAAGGAQPAAAAKPGAITFDSRKEYTTTDIDIRAKGTFQNVYNFMNELTTFPKLVVVDTLALRPEKEKEGETGASEESRQKEVEMGGYVTLRVEMPLTFYIQKQKSPDLTQAMAGEQAAAAPQ